MTRIQIRRDTSSNWATYNPVLADGEFALETDTRKLKIGNGEQPYTELAYQEGETYTLPPATADTLGGIKVGENLSITEDGVLNATGSTPSNMVTTDTTQTITGAKEFTESDTAFLCVITDNVRNKAGRNILAQQGAATLLGDPDYLQQYTIIWGNRDANIYARCAGSSRDNGILINTYNQSKLGAQYFNGSNQLVRLDSTGKLPAIDGSQLTNLPGGTAPSNMVTTDTPQNITSQKTFVGNAPVRIKNTNINKIATPFRLWQNSVAGNKIFLGDCPDSGMSTSDLPVAIVVPKTNKTVYKTNTGDLNTFVPILDGENFSSVAPTGNLKYWTGTEAEYTGLATKDADTLYRTTDTNKVYLGTIQLGGST